MFVLRLGFCALGQCDVLMPHLNPQTTEQAAGEGHCHPQKTADTEADLAVCCIDEDATQIQTIDFSFLNSTILMLDFIDPVFETQNLTGFTQIRANDFIPDNISPSRAIPVLTQRFLI